MNLKHGSLLHFVASFFSYTVKENVLEAPVVSYTNITATGSP